MKIVSYLGDCTLRQGRSGLGLDAERTAIASRIVTKNSSITNDCYPENDESCRYRPAAIEFMH